MNIEGSRRNLEITWNCNSSFQTWNLKIQVYLIFQILSNLLAMLIFRLVKSMIWFSHRLSGCPAELHFFQTWFCMKQWYSLRFYSSSHGFVSHAVSLISVETQIPSFLTILTETAWSFHHWKGKPEKLGFIFQDIKTGSHLKFKEDRT